MIGIYREVAKGRRGRPYAIVISWSLWKFPFRSYFRLITVSFIYSCTVILGRTISAYRVSSSSLLAIIGVLIQLGHTLKRSIIIVLAKSMVYNILCSSTYKNGVSDNKARQILIIGGPILHQLVYYFEIPRKVWSNVFFMYQQFRNNWKNKNFFW